MKIKLICAVLLLTGLAHTALADIDQAREAYFMGEYERAVAAFLPDAEAGNSYAQIKIGTMYENGWGVSKNFASAKVWYERAANAADPHGHVALAKLYGYGRGVTKDYNKAEMHLLEAVNLGHHHAYYILGDLHNDDYAFGYNEKKALEYYLLAAKYNAAAQSQRGHFRKGTGQWFRLITRDGVDATRQAADAGNIHAQFNVGLRYYFGEGVTKNHNTAHIYFQMAALSGNAEAQNYLAQNQVMQNPDSYDKILVSKWFTIAASSGYNAAMGNKTKHEASMTADEISQAERAAQEWINKQ